jgi:hypothetical protein
MKRTAVDERNESEEDAISEQASPSTHDEPEGRGLVSFASVDPAGYQYPHPGLMTFRFAMVAHRSGLEAEVGLAGDAVDTLKAAGVPDRTSASSSVTKPLPYEGH